MSIITMLIIGGWSATLSMIAVCALKESGKLRQIRRHAALWIDSSLRAAVPASEKNMERDVANAG
ncbi:MAG: hypothetical protein WCC32_00860 [Terriglobales bacterium]